MTDYLNASTWKKKTGCGNLYTTIRWKSTPQKLSPDISLEMGKGGGCAKAQLEMIARMMNLAIKLGGEIEAVKKEIKGIGCHQFPSCANAIAEAIEGFEEFRNNIEKGKVAESKTENNSTVVSSKCLDYVD